MDKNTEYRELGGEHTRVIDLGADKFALHFRADGMVLLYTLAITSRVRGRAIYQYVYTGLQYEDPGVLLAIFTEMEKRKSSTKYPKDKNNVD